MEHVTEQQLTRRQSTVWRALRAAAPQTIPVLAGYFVLGMGYGIYVQSLGLPVWMPTAFGRTTDLFFKFYAIFNGYKVTRSQCFIILMQ